MSVVDETLRLTGAPTLMATPPAGPLDGGSFTMTLLFTGSRRSEAHLLFAFQDKRTYRELVVQGTGRLRLAGRAGRRHQVVARARHRFTPGTAALVRLDFSGATATVSIDGSTALSGTFVDAAQGRFAVKAVRGTFAIDDVCIATASAGG
jgi:hypothetical protein